MIVIRVQDTGCGIAGEHLPHVFERFRQVDSSTARGYGGLGLGLAIVRHLVDAHGGSVSAESAGVGRGATFTVRLPIHASTAQVAAAASASTETHASDEVPSRSIQNVRVLVVEDDADSLELVRYALEAAGATVTAATSARAALSEEGPFDIIVSDIGMPGVDGYAFIRAVRSRDVGAGIPAIALTAYARPQDEARALRSGYQAHLPKPLDASKLIEAVKRWSA
jgi:CheY-like chemotaxis protein